MRFCGHAFAQECSTVMCENISHTQQTHSCYYNQGIPGYQMMTNPSEGKAILLIVCLKRHAVNGLLRAGW